MGKRKVTIINNTQFKTEDISEITYALLESQLAPSFFIKTNGGKVRMELTTTTTTQFLPSLKALGILATII